LFHAQCRVHRVASEHGLFHDGMVAAHDDAAVFRIADDDFASFSAMVKEGRFAVAHGLLGFRRRGIIGLRGLLDLDVALEHGAEKRDAFDVEKRHIDIK
jgi:hypothetical protein